jgi:hypothetical protein
MAIALYMDVHVPQAITEQLRRRGIDVLTAFEDRTTELPDDQLLVRVTELNRMLFTQDIAEWWETFSRYPLVMTSRVVTHRGENIDNDIFRRCLTENKLPDVYSALMYFRWSDEAADVFTEFENVTFSWQAYWEKFLEPVTRPSYFSTDVALSIALRLTDHEHDFVLPRNASPTFVHMKSALQNWNFNPLSKDWQDHISSNLSNHEIKLGRFAPRVPIHYVEKSFLTDKIIEILENG